MKLSWVFVILLLTTVVGFGQESFPVASTIHMEKKAYEPKEQIAFILSLKNTSSRVFNIFSVVNSSKVIVNGKEYVSRNNFPLAWGGPDTLQSGATIDVELILSGTQSNYDIPSSVLVPGSHELVLKINKSISNTVVFEVLQK